MLSCARGAVSRALRPTALRYNSRPFAHRLSHGIHNETSARFSITPSVGAKRQIRIPRRNFSSTPLQQQDSISEDLTDVFPVCCPGCGAFSQTIEPDEPGHYNLERKKTRKLLASKRDAIEKENAVWEAAITEASGNSDAAEDLQHQDTVTEERAAPRPHQGRSLSQRA